MSIWPNVVTGVCTLLAGLGGSLGAVWLTQRGNRDRWLYERRDTHRIEKRAAVVEVLRVGPDWRTALDGVMMRVAAFPDPVELAKSVEGDTWGARREEFNRALVTARIIVTEPEIKAILDRLTKFNTELPQDWYRAVHDQRTDRSQLGETALQLGDAIAAALTELEQRAAETYSALPMEQRRKPAP